jgi:acetyl esterase/lipase
MKNLRWMFILGAVAMGMVQTGWTQVPSNDPWVDYASGAYDIFPNITYSTASSVDLKLDLYLPKNRTAPLPTLVLFHGGGWVAGQKERNVMQLLPYLSMGWVVVNVEYRMAKTALAPAAVEDGRCVLRWVQRNAKQYGIDTSRVVLTGGSAGGHLALIVGMLPASSPFDRACPVDETVRWSGGEQPPLKVAAIVNFYGITDVADLLEGPNAKPYAIEWFGSLPNRKELAEQLSPLSYVRPGQPAVITLHGDKDNVVPYDQAKRLHAALEKTGVKNELVTVKGAMHGGFNKQALIDGFASIRKFLGETGVIEKGGTR